MNTFDLIEFQQRAGQLTDSKKLFDLLEDCYRRYERKEIGLYELEEMKSAIHPRLKALAALRRDIDGVQTTDSNDQQVAGSASIDSNGADENKAM